MAQSHYEKREQMEEFIDLEPVELNDDELAAVAGGFALSISNSTVTNSQNNSGNVTISNATIGSNSFAG
jgi:hypothetical protein